jgi:PAS domain-containing protein
MPRSIGSAKERIDELRESEVRFRSLSALSADVYWEQDEQLRFTSFSEAGSQEFEPGRLDSLLGTKRWESEYINMTQADRAAHRHRRGIGRSATELCRCERGAANSDPRSGEPVFDACEPSKATADRP